MKLKETLIWKNEQSLIYRQPTPNGSVIRKVMRPGAADPEAVFRLRNEFAFSSDTSLEGIRHALRMENYDQNLSIVFEDIEGVSLLEEFVNKRQPLEKVLQLFIDLSSILGGLHNKGIIHKDINPTNLLWYKKKAKPIIIDFGIATRIDFLASNLGNPDRIKGTLAYISPEQTGRVNRRVDNRSDLYSLGVTLYQVLTGKLPFESNDSLELVHFHIAKSIPLVHRLNPELPEVLSFIVEKLMAKNADDRYQTAYGLQADLEKCLLQWNKSRTITSFPPGQEDFSGKFKLPQRLYGRDAEIKMLLTSFDRVSHGSAELFLVTGYSGVGKSSLVSELYKPITAQRGNFISGKFDQYQKNIPFLAISQAFDGLCNMLLTEDADIVAVWEAAIRGAVGENGAVLVDIIPALEKIIGKQPPVPKLDSQEALNRFNLVFLNFVHSLCSANHPLVLFLDDLQWADSGSLNLIKLLVTDVQNQYLLVLGAYRNNEILPGHPLTTMLNDLENEKAVVHGISLSSLKEEDVKQIIANSLDTKNGDLNELTAIVYSKTKGNAFFTLEFLKALHQQQLIKYDFGGKKWQVDIQAIHGKDVSENVVDLLVKSLKELPADTIRTLTTASCIGGIFDMDILARLLGSPGKVIIESLWPALKDELINPTNDKFQFINVLDPSEYKGQDVQFSFAHDRIQQAAYYLVDPLEAEKTHLQIGRYLMARDGASDDINFSLVVHYNGGLQHVTDKAERISIAKLNLRAAIQARDSSAYASAHSFAEIALGIFSEDLWKSEYAFAFKLHTVAADIAYLLGDFNTSEELLDIALKSAQSSSDKAEVYFLLMQSQSNSTRYYEAIESARQGLKLLDFEFPAKDDCPPQIPVEMGKAITWFATNGVDKVFEQPVMTDQRILSAIKILDNLSPPTYVTGEVNMWILHVLFKVNLTLEHGLSPQGGYAFSELGLIFFILNNYEYAYPAAKMSMRIVEKFAVESPRHLSRAGHLFTNYNTPWVKHISETFKLNSEYYQRSLESGELIFAGYTSFHPFYSAYYHGKDPLHMLLQKLPDAKAYTGKIKHDLAHDSLRAMDLCIANLMGNTSGDDDFDIENDSESKLITYCQEVKDGYGMTMFYLLKAHTHYLHGNMQKAKEALNVVEGLTAVLSGNAPTSSFFNMLQSLTALDDMHNGRGDRSALEAKVEANQKQMAIWAEHNEANFQHKYLLVEAERKRVTNEFSREALELYGKAAKSAELNEFNRELAIIHLRNADYWLALEQPIYAQPHMQKALYLLQSLDYKRMVKKLEKAHPELISAIGLQGLGAAQKSTMSGTFDSTLDLNYLDLNSVIKASNALSEEIVMGSFIDRMLHIVIENAGAQRALLVLPRRNGWEIAAELNLNDQEAKLIQDGDLGKVRDIQRGIINYVLRTTTEIVSSTETSKQLFDRDEGKAKLRPASFFCIPIQYKGSTKAILYAEHLETIDAFTPQRLSLIKVLSSQMAVSLENARLYQNQTELNIAYQRFVPHDFIRMLGHDSILDVRLGDSTDAEITILFCDIRSYTTLSEYLSPAECFALINSYLSYVGPIIESNNGFINHYLGDGFIALFKNGAKDALNAAEQIIAQMSKFNKLRSKKDLQAVNLGIGIHTGKVMMGIIGDAERHDANVLSDAVNIASRLEGLTKVYGSQIIISDVIRKDILKDNAFHTRFLGRVRLKGKEENINVYEVFNQDQESVLQAKLETAAEYDEALIAYFNKDFSTAIGLFSGVLKINKHDMVTGMYLQKAAQYLANGVPENWNGVEQMTDK
ncbi:MAG: AAA family ATPase [Algoriphagus sp.]|uniref:AAA family ATPase n=1 Tax=Algoriphagus sp. TaxID=1872435 RepID=UPI0026076683|nr:AAA family ATPase [Algoriphagus sp.]MDG1276413.1 AAA family ATPase [Algoriphagus sp.]